MLIESNRTLFLLLLVAVGWFFPLAIRTFRENERGVVFTLGRFWRVKGPGFVLIIPVNQKAIRVDLRTVVLEVPTQDVISRDNVSVKVSAVVYLEEGLCLPVRAGSPTMPLRLEPKGIPPWQRPSSPA